MGRALRSRHRCDDSVDGTLRDGLQAQRLGAFDCGMRGAAQQRQRHLGVLRRGAVVACGELGLAPGEGGANLGLAQATTLRHRRRIVLDLRVRVHCFLPARA